MNAVVNIGDIQKIVVNFYDISITDFLFKLDDHIIARPRQIAMCLDRLADKKSVIEIS